MLRSTLAALTLVATLPAAAQTLRAEQTWGYGAWSTATMLNVDYDRRFCAAETSSDQGQVFRIVLYEDEDAFLEILDDGWTFNGGDSLRFTLAVDGEAWAVDGQGWSGAMTWDLLDTADRNTLFTRLSNGERLEVTMPDGSPAATFSLDGADTAIAEANHCWAVERNGGDYQP